MRIEKISINSFGMLVSRTFDFAEKINLVEGDNESGKSTLSAFIKFMLYGLDKKAGADKLSERNRYINWKSDEASGSMILVHDDKRYKIERSVRLSSRSESGRENYRESVSVIEVDTGIRVFDGEVPGEVFLGVPKDVFENTAYIKQLDVSGVDGSLVGEAIQNILYSADESINTQRACDKLDMLRRGLLHKNEHGGAIYELTLEKSSTESLLARAKEENAAIIALEGVRAEDIKRIEECKAKLAELGAKKEAHDILDLLRRFESMHALTEKIDALKREYETYAKENGHEGFLPDREYVRELGELERAMISARAELLSIENEYSKLKYDSAHNSRLLQIYEQIRDAGGEDAVNKEHGDLLRANKNMGVLGIASLSLGALTLVGGIVSATLSMLVPGVILLGVGVILVGIGAAALVLGAGKKKKANELLLKLGVREGERLSDVIAHCRANEEEERRLREVLFVAENDIKNKKSELEDKERELARVAAKWGKDASDVGALVSDALAIAERAEEIEFEIKKYIAPAESAKRELAGHNEDELKRRFVALGVADADTLNISTLTREIEFLQSKTETLNYRKIETEKQLIALGATSKDPMAISAKLDDIEQRLSEMKKKHAAYKLAHEAIEEASKNLRESITPRLSESAKGYMSTFTGGRYSEGGFAQNDGEFSISFEHEGSHRKLETLSAGTRDAAYISLRLALVELLYRHGTPTMVLDESFAYIDDTRTANLLSLFERGDMQTVIFSCKNRERALLEGKEYNYIKL